MVDNILSPQGYDEDVDKPPRSVVSEEAATLQKILGNAELAGFRPGRRKYIEHTS